MKKKNTKTFVHKINARSKDLLVVTVIGKVDAIESMTYRGAKLDTFARKKGWRFKKQFPYIERYELGIYTTSIAPKR